MECSVDLRRIFQGPSPIPIRYHSKKNAPALLSNQYGIYNISSGNLVFSLDYATKCLCEDERAWSQRSQWAI